MKKLLAMVLALVMTLSLCTVTNAFADDKDINEDYAEAVETLNGMGVFKGYEDGSFKPNGNITRAEVAAIIYRLYTGDVKDKQAGLYAGYGSFSDMAGATWAAGYVGYCANAGFVKGYGNGKFGPSDPVTGYQALAMILRAVGYGKNGEFEGADWELHVAQIAQQVGALENVKGVSLKAAASRELVAELLFQVAAYVPTVTYTPALGYNQYTTLNGKTENDTLGEINFGLDKTDKDNDKFGRPVYSWTNGKTGSKKVTYSTVYAKPLFTFVEATKNCDIYDESGLKKGTELDVYTNSATKDGTYTIADNTKEYGAQGRLTEVYEDRIVNIDTYLAEVGKVVAEKTDSKGHVTKAYVLVDKIHGLDKFTEKFETDGFEKGDFVLVTVADGEIQSMVAAETKVGTLTKIAGNRKTIYNVTDVMGVDKEDVAANHTAVYLPCDVLELGSTYNFYYDTYGNVIGADELGTNYAVLDSLYTKLDKGDETATGKLVYFDGTSEEVEIDRIVYGNGYDDCYDFSFAKYWNSEYYYTVYAYTEKDGAYTLDNSGFTPADEAEYRAGSKYMMAWGNDATKKLQLSKNSQILLQTKDSPDGTFKAYTGYADLPSFECKYVQYTTDGNGYVDMLYAYASEFTSRTVFVYDTKPSYSWIDDEGNTIATMDVLELVDDELKDTTVNVYYDFIDKDEAWGGDIDEIGLYEITEGEEGIWYAIDRYYADTIKKVTGDGKRVEIDGRYADLDDAKIVKYVGTWVKGEYDLEWTHKDLVADGYAFGYVQYDEDGKVVAVYDLWIKVDVKFAEDWKDVDANATIDAPDMYFGRDAKDFTVDVSKWVKVDAVANGRLNNSGYTATSEDEHNVARTFKVTASADTKVAGDIVVTLAEDPAHSEVYMTAKAPATFSNISVAVNQRAKTITVSKTEVAVSSPLVNDVAQWLKAEGTHNQGYTFYNNTEANPVDKDSATAIDFVNLYVKCVAEDGTIETYQVVLGK